MISILLCYTSMPQAIMIFLLVTASNKKWAVLSLLPIWALAALIVYFLLPSRNLLSILWGNVIYGGLYWALACNAYDYDDYLTKNGWITVITVLSAFLLACLGGSLHSHMSVKPTWDSIPKEYSKSTEAPTFKRNETPIALAPKTVINRVRKASSDIPNTQYYSISDEIQSQYYKGKPVYVIPIEYNGFFQSNRAGEIPGYFIIDATRQNATPIFVKKPYYYAVSGYFNKDASRQIYRHNPSWLSLDTPQLEIDDNGDPYWVQTVYKSEPFSHRVNFSRLHVAVLNARTGVTKTYSVHNMPKFIDEGITTGIADKINNDFGKYKYGFWNWSKTGIMKPTGNGVENGVTSVFNKDGSISYFTDFTTDKTGADSALGYSMINARTGKLTFYRTNNIMDSDGAKNNANQDYKAQRWHANMPILYNVNNRPTWVMTILDSTHAIRGYYYLDASDQSVYGTGSNPTSALDSFRQALVDSGASAGNTPGEKKKNFSGVIDRAAVVSNKNKAMFMLKGKNIIFTVNTNDYDFANLIRPGDKVKFSANVVKGKSIGNVNEFKDESLD